MSEEAAIRRANLAASGVTPTQLVNAVGHSPGYWSTLKNDPKKAFGEKVARKIEEALGWPRGWLDQPHLRTGEVPPTYWTKDQSPKGGIAQPMSHRPFDTPPLITWEELMQSTELPPLFMVAMPDDSMSPRIERGTELIFSRTDAPGPGKGVLVRDQAGQLHVRRYRQGSGGQWIAQAVNEADFAPLDSERQQLQIVAVLRGVMSGRI